MPELRYSRMIQEINDSATFSLLMAFGWHLVTFRDRSATTTLGKPAYLGGRSLETGNSKDSEGRMSSYTYKANQPLPFSLSSDCENGSIILCDYCSRTYMYPYL